MKTLLLLAVFSLVAGVAVAAPRASVVLHPAASVSGDAFELSDIASVTSTDTAFRLRLMTAEMGRCPLPGLSRQFDEGDVALKLRQVGIDPETIVISGSAEMVVTCVGGQAPSAPIPGPSSAAVSVALDPHPVVVHYGDNLTLVYDCDGMTISASVVAMSSGGVGDTISLRRDGAVRPLTGIVQDAQTVKMVE